MKKSNRILAALLTLLTLLSVFVACGDNTQGDPQQEETPADVTTIAPPEDDQTDAPIVETTPVETERSEIKDNLPDDFNLGGKVITILTRNGNYRTLDIDGGGTTSGEVVSDAVYQRTLAVEERLGFKFNVIENADGYEVIGTQLSNTVNSGDDIYQIASISCNGTMGMSLDYIFQPVQDSMYLDLDQPWWWKEAILEGSMDGKTVRYFFGDANLTAYNYSGAMLFNKALFENGIGSTDDFYQLVLDRKWTFDKMAEYAQQLRQDLNGNETVDIDDLHGLYLDTKEYIKFFEYATDLRRYTRGENGLPIIDYDVDKATSILEKLYGLIKNTPGVYWDPAERSRRRDVFANGNAVFYATILGDAYNATIRNMSDPYGIIPYPMLDEAQGEYNTFIHNSSATFAIPITNKDPESSCAALEALCAESYRSVIEVYFETGLKTKYSADSKSAQCIDIIRKVTKKHLLSSYSAQVDGSGFWITDQITSNSTNFASTYAVKARSANRKLEKLFDSLNYTE